MKNDSLTEQIMQKLLLDYSQVSKTWLLTKQCQTISATVPFKPLVDQGLLTEVLQQWEVNSGKCWCSFFSFLNGTVNFISTYFIKTPNRFKECAIFPGLL